MPQQWKKTIISHIYKEGYKTDFQLQSSITVINCIQNFTQCYSTTLTPYSKQIIWDYRCGFSCNRSTTDQIFCIRQILGEKLNWSGGVLPVVSRSQDIIWLSQERNALMQNVLI